MRDRKKSEELLKAFRESRSQIQQKPIENSKRNSQVTYSRGYREKQPKSNYDPYTSFLEKYNHLDKSIDSFKTQDLMYFFRHKANEKGIKYVIANTKKDMAVFKKLQSNYTPREICLMIEFIFFSEQDYLDPKNTQPTVLLSSWCNTIYHDSILWANDEYFPKERKPTKSEQKKKREWNRAVYDEVATIGEWEDE